MIVQEKLAAIRDLVQHDVGNRGLARHPHANLLNACPHDLDAACRTIAHTRRPSIAIATGFVIPTVEPPRAETDGPLGALFLTRVLHALDCRVVLLADSFCRPALAAGLRACRLADQVDVLDIPRTSSPTTSELLDRITHLVAVECVGPNHTPKSLAGQPGCSAALVEEFCQRVPAMQHDCCHNMRGRDITAWTSPVHLLFDSKCSSKEPPTPVTIGIGDGGNEIGMGKVPWDVIRRNIPSGELIACRIPTHHLIVAGVSNWGAYALAAGTALCRDAALDPQLFTPQSEQEMLRVLVEEGGLIDGVTGKPELTVDGLPFEDYIQPLVQMGQLVC